MRRFRARLRRKVNPARTLALRVFFLAFAIGMPAFGQTNDPRLRLLPPLANGWVRLDLPDTNNHVVQLQTSPDLVAWTNLATAIGGLSAYPDPASTNLPWRFYRAQLWPLAASNDWKNQLLFPNDPFRSPSADPTQPRWVKFAILTSDPTRVYYQDSSKYLFHYDFAHARLEPFRTMSRAEFDLVSLHPTNQAIVLGTVLFPPGVNAAEYGIQFVGLEPYPAEAVAQCFDLVKATIVAAPGVEVFYLPTLEQRAAAETNRDFFAARNIPVSSADRWATGDSLYAPGWALGRLVYFPANEIASAYTAGLLRPEDILITDAVPAEVPYLAGIVSLTAATLNSHVAILAQSYGVPFVYLVNPYERARVLQWTNQEVLLRAYGGFPPVIDLAPIQGQLDQGFRADLAALKAPPALRLQPKAPWGAFTADTADLEPGDIHFFGGKAANFGFLRRQAPTNSPDAIAFSFDLWDAFMDQIFTNGLTLRQAISNRLAAYTWPPPMSALLADLAIVRDWIRAAAFTPEQQQVITNALTRFDPSRKIRFRSSTNVEDSENFTGAGLYDSFSGCLADDLDEDAAGPSRCDPAETGERGVFRAIQRVYASLYNDNAFLERLRYRVPEALIGMGVLVHYSFPDATELANGVATLSRTPENSSLQIELASQEGAVSVTNPDGSALPEVISASRYDFGTFFNLRQRSSLVPLGAYVLQWESEYRQLTDLLAAVTTGFRQYYPKKDTFTLDFEYKKVGAGLLELKQVRELPVAAPATNIAPFLLNQPMDYEVFQGEFGTVFGNHRLKSAWRLATGNLRLTGTNLAQTIYTDATLTLLDDTSTLTLSGPPSSWANYSHSNDNQATADHWTVGSGTDRRDFTLYTRFVTPVPVSKPIVLLADFALELSVDYARPMPGADSNGQSLSVTNEIVRLSPPAPVAPDSMLQVRDCATNGLSLTTSFYWPKPPVGAIAGYTAPLVRFVETRIDGLTSQPLVLGDPFAQTYRPGHHNFFEEFLFEPLLDPNVTAEQRNQLAAAKIRLIYLRTGTGSAAEIILVDSEGQFRRP